MVLWGDSVTAAELVPACDDTGMTNDLSQRSGHVSPGCFVGVRNDDCAVELDRLLCEGSVSWELAFWFSTMEQSSRAL